ncbi:dosage compensation regulator-like isoform X2 [Adelges cooleyi]|uniref:dosage compensation regulator-like isoform X2 n=1 Tax=Adelges cooleyi TaxID=133065 RepID=UPI00217F8F78|nr:dosage compensation regulator-like isoform X2 [Adelges cooleyi]
MDDSVESVSEAETLIRKICSTYELQPKFEFCQNEFNSDYYQIAKLTIPEICFVGIGIGNTLSDAKINSCLDFIKYLNNTIEPNCNKLLESNICLSDEYIKLKGYYSYYKLSKDISIDNQYLLSLLRLSEQEDFVLRDTTDCFDDTAHSNGNWTTRNAKKQLEWFMSSNEINCNYKYYVIGYKCYVAELTLFITHLNTYVTGWQPDKSTKKATKRCALSVVRQLYHLGVIKDYDDKIKYADFEIDYEVKVNKELVDRLEAVLEELNIKPIEVDENCDNSISLIPNLERAKFKELIPPNATGFIPWSPIELGFNCWSGTVNRHGVYIRTTLDDISVQLAKEYEAKLNCPDTKNDIARSMAHRSKLPVYSKKTEILEAIRNNSVVIIQGGTGCGKTTQVCQYILDDYVTKKKGAYCNIICTQPRRLSSISVAERVAEERLECLGESVGYSIRFDSIIPRHYGSILFCTDGIMMLKMESGLHGISHIIVDEVHERHTHTDFFMIVLKDMVNMYPELRVILMSATLDIKLFSSYFNDCPVIEVEGTCHPVEEYFLEDIVKKIDFQPKTTKRIREKIKNQEDNCNVLVSEDYPAEVRERVAMISEYDNHFELVETLIKFIVTNEEMCNIPGAILIFLPGIELINGLYKRLMKNPYFENCEEFRILSLHANLRTSEQRKVFEPVGPGVRKVILATNIAETSITIEDVVFVIDYGKRRLNLFTAHNNTSEYATFWESKANRKQRMGRAGRVRPGYCFLLCTKERYYRMDDHLEPPILWKPLHEIALKIKLLRLGDIKSFFNKALQPPAEDTINQAIQLECIGENLELTWLGLIAAKLPIEARYTRMIVLGSFFNLGEPLALIAATHADQSDFFNRGKNLELVKRKFSGNRCSAQVAILNIYYQWEYKNKNQLSDWNFVEVNMLNYTSMVVTRRIKESLISKMSRMEFPRDCMSYVDFDYDKTKGVDDSKLDLLSAILTVGFYPNIGYHLTSNKMLTEGKEIAYIKKGSINCQEDKEDQFASPFFVFAERIRSHQLQCVQTSMVTPIHLLLFGARTIEYYNGRVIIDSWIKLKMDVKTAAAIVALRLAIKEIMVQITENPRCVLFRSNTDQRLIQILVDLCNFNAGRCGLPAIEFDKKCNNYVGCNEQKKSETNTNNIILG